MTDVKKEDRSEESRNNHIIYYRSLGKVILDLKKEETVEDDPIIKNHLNKRIEAMEQDRKRIREMFPDINKE